MSHLTATKLRFELFHRVYSGLFFVHNSQNYRRERNRIRHRESQRRYRSLSHSVS
ncbi:hypothetical protein BOX15_Mlig025813g1 [Macrostomum lignano]|uniref:Uncharacterized protein n=1 Tax=Macrostomum lignano TaxID=282301 RepID=A0A267FE00_9PLAT|nr:hypothetical protein BOX15_Mlig025813g1 [Macrostomum lignano]